MVTTNQKNTTDTHKKRKRNPNTTLKLANKSQEKKREKEEKNTYKNKSKTINKRTIIKTYISIMILNINRLNAPTKRH